MGATGTFVRVVILGAAALGIHTTAVAGQAIQFAFDGWYGDDTSPSGSGPWLLATFEDTDQDTVHVTIENFLLSEDEHVKQIDFNLDPAFDCAQLEIEQSADGPQASEVLAQSNSFDAGSVVGFDIEMRWAPLIWFPGGSNNVVEFDISGIPGLTAESFAVTNSDGLGPFYAAAHIGGIGSGGLESSWLSVSRPTVIPLPAPLLLAGAGLGVVPFLRRKVSGR